MYLNQIQNETESSINGTFKVALKEIFVNLTYINQPSINIENKSWFQEGPVWKC